MLLEYRPETMKALIDHRLQAVRDSGVGDKLRPPSAGRREAMQIRPMAHARLSGCSGAQTHGVSHLRHRTVIPVVFGSEQRRLNEGARKPDAVTGRKIQETER